MKLYQMKGWGGGTCLREEKPLNSWSLPRVPLPGCLAEVKQAFGLKAAGGICVREGGDAPLY